MDDKNNNEELKKEPENVTREINLDELYDGVINNTVVIDPLTKDEVLLRPKKNNFLIIILVFIVLVLLLLYYLNNKAIVGITVKDNSNDAKNNKVITTTKILNLKGSINCTYSSKSDSDSQSVNFIANYENNKILDSSFDFVVISLNENASDVIKNMMEQYEEFYINNASVTGNNISFEKNDKGFTFNIKTDYNISSFDDINLIDGKTILYVKPLKNDTVDIIKDEYENKGFTCNIIKNEDVEDE